MEKRVRKSGKARVEKKRKKNKSFWFGLSFLIIKILACASIAFMAHTFCNQNIGTSWVILPHALVLQTMLEAVPFLLVEDVVINIYYVH